MSNIYRQDRGAAANRLREIRLNMGVSQETFAEYLDISLSAYKKIESTENGISVNILKKLKERFNVSSDYLLFGEYKSASEALEIIDNCSEEDKMKLYLRLTRYFVSDKKKIFVEQNTKTKEFSDTLINLLDMR